MSWRFDPAAALSNLREAPAKPAKPANATPPHPPTLAALATLADPLGENEGSGKLNPAPVPADSPAPLLTPDQCQEAHGWPTKTQRVFVAVLDHFEGRGFVLTEAEALAYATMQALMHRRDGLIRFADSKMPDELSRVLGALKGVFGSGLQVEWRPALWPEKQPEAEQWSGLVCCQNCQLFERGKGDQNNALGLCQGQPWDGNRGQWPKAHHTCGNYTPG